MGQSSQDICHLYLDWTKAKVLASNKCWPVSRQKKQFVQKYSVKKYSCLLKISWNRYQWEKRQDINMKVEQGPDSQRILGHVLSLDHNWSSKESQDTDSGKQVKLSYSQYISANINTCCRWWLDNISLYSNNNQYTFSLVPLIKFGLCWHQLGY